ncbi:hypothetical protein BO71DRAFT_95550, partial [Aspergillus ellipticus CBS 707.79]
TNERTVPVSSDTFSDWHTYTIDWKPDVLEWYVDDVLLRTLTKNSTYNATADRYQYPQTPSRLEMSIWPGGSEAEGEGTIEWAGGLVDWDSTDIKEYGYFYAQYQNITVECYPPPADTMQEGDVSYVYTSDSGLSDTIEISGNSTVLNNLEDSGLNMTSGTKVTATDDSSSSGSGSGSGSGTSSGSSSSSTKSGASANGQWAVQGSLVAAVGAVVAFSFL